ncbi:MAG: hypothetical protein KA732_21040 [Providencia sp.]|nr:hypothetical protein [Providencia sp.]
MIIQRIWGSLGSLYLKRPNILANWFDAKGYRIANLGKPKRDSDAVDLGTLKDEISSVNSTILKKEKRTFRVDDIDIPAFPSISERRNKQIGFNSSGIPTLLDPAETGALGYILVDSFEKGATLTGRFQALFWEEKKEYFRWDGPLDKVVPPNSTPNETGGIKTDENPNGLWVSVGDASLRGELVNVVPTYNSVLGLISDKRVHNNKIADVISFFSDKGRGGGRFIYKSDIDKSTHNGGTIIDPTAQYPTNWKDNQQLTNWFNSANEGNGVWVKLVEGAVNISEFGYLPEYDCTKFLFAVEKSEIKHLHLDSNVGISDHITLKNIDALTGDSVEVKPLSGTPSLKITADTYDVSSKLVSSIGAGDLFFTLNSQIQDLEVGDALVFIHDIPFSFSEYRENYKTSEIVVVNSVHGNSVKIEKGFIFNYADLVNTKIIHFKGRELAINGVNFVGVRVSYLNRAQLNIANSSVTTEFGNHAALIGRCISIEARNFTAINNDDDDSKFGYGVMLSGAQDAIIKNSSFIGRRHGSASGSGTFDDKSSSLSINIVLDGCYLESRAQSVGNTAAYDNHGASYKCRVINSVCNGGVVLGGYLPVADNCDVSRKGVQFPLSFREVIGGDIVYRNIRAKSVVNGGRLLGTHSSSESGKLKEDINFIFDNIEYSNETDIANLIEIPNSSVLYKVNVRIDTIKYNMQITDSVVYTWNAGLLGKVDIKNTTGKAPYRWLKYSNTLNDDSLLSAPAFSQRLTVNVPKGGAGTVNMIFPTRLNTAMYSQSVVLHSDLPFNCSVLSSPDDSAGYQQYAKIYVSDDKGRLADGTTPIAISATIIPDNMQLKK